MADINLAPARILRAAINTTPGNEHRFQAIGTLQAMNSPQSGELRKAMSPVAATADKRLSWQAGAGRHDAIPVVRLNYRKQYSTGKSRSTRTVGGGGQAPAAPTEVDVTYNNYKEYPLEFTTLNFASLEPAAKAYYEQENNQNGINLSEQEIASMAEVRNEVLLTIEQDLLQPMNSQCVTALVAAIGTNAVTGTAVPKNIPLYQADKQTPRKDFLRFLDLLRVKHGVKGKWIIIGGDMLYNYMQDSKILSVTSAGLNTQAMYAQLPVEWYYDPSIDTIYGQNKILVIDPGSAAYQAILEHGAYGPVKQKEVANTSFATGSISIAQFLDSTAFQLPIDLRVRAYDTEKYPFWEVVISSGLFGVFTRPAGFLKTYGGFQTYTGIIGVQLQEVEPTV